MNRRIKLETIRETLARYGYLDEVTTEIGTYPEHHARALRESLGWDPADGCGRDMRRLIDAFHRYATLVREIREQRLPVGDLVQCLLTLVVG